MGTNTGTITKYNISYAKWKQDLIARTKKVYGDHRREGDDARWRDLKAELDREGIKHEYVCKVLKSNKKEVLDNEIAAIKRHNARMRIEDYNPKKKDYFSLLGCVTNAVMIVEKLWER